METYIKDSAFITETLSAMRFLSEEVILVIKNEGFSFEAVAGGGRRPAVVLDVRRSEVASYNYSHRSRKPWALRLNTQEVINALRPRAAGGVDVFVEEGAGTIRFCHFETSQTLQAFVIADVSQSYLSVAAEIANFRSMDFFFEISGQHCKQLMILKLLNHTERLKIRLLIGARIRVSLMAREHQGRVARAYYPNRTQPQVSDRKRCSMTADGDTQLCIFALAESSRLGVRISASGTSAKLAEFLGVPFGTLAMRF